MNDIENTPLEHQEQAKSRKKKILSIILFLLANALVVLVVILMEDKSQGMEPWINVRGYFRANWYYLVLAFSMFFIILTGDTIVFFTLNNRMQRKNNLALSLKVSIVGRYYDRITPWATGGVPSQLAYLMKNKMKASDACAVTMSRHIMRFFVTAPAVIIILAASQITTNVWIMVLAVLSVFIGLIVPTFMLICAYKPKLGYVIAKGVISLLYKMKIVKDYDKEIEKLTAGVDNFVKGIQCLNTNKWVIIVLVLATLIELFANNAVPFFVMKALGASVNYWNIFVLCIFVAYASSLAPTPGGAGLAELSFYAIFASFLEGGLIFWAVLFWRLAIYYAPILLGFLLQLIEGAKGIAKSRKNG